MGDRMTAEIDKGENLDLGHFARRVLSASARTGVAFTLILAACKDASAATPIPPDGETAVVTVPPTETATSTEVNFTAPESFTSQKEILEKNGYVIQKNETGQWAIFDQATATEVTHAKDANTLVYQTQEGEEIEASAETFKVHEVAGVDVKAILTIQDSNGKVDTFFLNHKGVETDYRYWTTPIEVQTNPEVIENYTPITMEDVWTGRLLFSELLDAEPFPKGTLVPDGFFYDLQSNDPFFSPKASVGSLDTFIAGTSDLCGLDGPADCAPYNFEAKYYRTVNVDNDFKRWTAFYKSQTLGGQEVIVATEQILSKDGNSSYFYHYIFGHEWPWDRQNKNTNGETLNLIDSLFLAKKSQVPAGEVHKYVVRPVLFFDPAGVMGAEYPFDSSIPSAGAELYNLDQNNPLKILNTDRLSAENIQNYVDAQFPYMGDAGDEIKNLQYIFLLGFATVFSEKIPGIDEFSAQELYFAPNN